MNPLDTKIPRGEGVTCKATTSRRARLDMAGVVEEVGHGVAAFSCRNEVYGMVRGVGSPQGTLAEFIGVDADLLAQTASP